MNKFEKEYYESDEFWAGEMLQDRDNIQRFEKTSAIIPLSVKSLVDVGCGNGVFLNRLQRIRPELDLWGIDRSKKALEFVNTKKVEAEITSLPFEDRSFDCVTCLEVLEHLNLEDYSLALSELSRVSKNYIIISVPFEEDLERSYTKCPSCLSIFNYELHLRSFSESSFLSLFKLNGFINVESFKLGESHNYRGHYQYRKLFYPEQILKWRSVICPLCGYKEFSNKPALKGQEPLSMKRKLISYLSALPKLVWPKERRYYWILGIFKRIEE